MRIAIPLESNTHEFRVSATADGVKQYIKRGFDVVVQQQAGLGAFISDDDYIAAGAQIADDFASCCGHADLVLKVAAPNAEELAALPASATVICMAAPFTNPLLSDYAAHGLACFAMEMIPRISRAQSMDALSSQANIAGYKSVLVALEYYSHFMPMLMTAAGTVKPAKVLVMGAGVAGLQAIATARRLGALVEAFDVRAAAREQVESLGASFIEVPVEENAEDAGGYAREMSDDYKQKQAELIAQHAAKADIVITTALIPGRPAPILVTQEVVEQMRAGSVIVDMAVEMGGNCPLSVKDEVIQHRGVTVVGISNIPALMASDASQLYGRNIANFIDVLWQKDEQMLNINLDDEIIASALLCQNGTFLKPQLLERRS
ncbi:MAG: Re/Si-specific NAD(P)(+) transhydrogenase subunit alpha [Mariprofundaceae bacterium]|nr:Re/Si-specific NAD(P)(+) transhydrogenase subunit alpha [Mariprofundaceae bacterium]